VGEARYQAGNSCRIVRGVKEMNLLKKPLSDESDAEGRGCRVEG